MCTDMTTNGQDTFVFFLYAKRLIHPQQLVQIGIDGGDTLPSCHSSVNIGKMGDMSKNYYIPPSSIISPPLITWNG